jgi:hypothetical protein
MSSLDWEPTIADIHAPENPDVTALDFPVLGRAVDRSVRTPSWSPCVELEFDKEEMTGTASDRVARTILDEVLGVRLDYIEHQLAHALRDPNGRALQPYGASA